MRRALELMVLSALCVLAAAPAMAHAIRTAYLEITEIEPGRALVRWRLPVPVPGVAPRLPAACRVLETADRKGEEEPAGSRPGSDGTTFAVDCEGGLAGATIAIDGLGPQIPDAVVQVSLADGSSSAHRITAAAPAWRLPRSRSPLEVAREYIGLGVEHILGGADHLLFLLLLVLTLRRPGAVLLAETAFTLSHSLSFAATALGLVTVSSGAAEACIALSLVLVALDVERAGAPPVSARAGAAMAFVFGLVHGLGFAGGLQELGLPEAHAAWALVGFGVGVELGQVAFLGVALAAVSLVARSPIYRPMAVALAYLSGGVAMYWLIARVGAL